MAQTKLDLSGLKCPLPALKTRKALKSLNPGDRLEVHCTDPLSVIDIPALVRETGDSVEITYRGAVVARLTPAEDSRGYGDFATAWKHFDDVVREIGKRGKKRKTAAKAGATWRRDL